MQHAPPIADPRDILARYFGFDTFRPGRREAIDAVLAGHDALAVLPTGTGKSLIYQVAALALMRDQTERLRERHVPGIGALHSQIPESEQRETLAALRDGTLNLLYVRTRLEMLRAHARVESSRRQFILRYFGQYDAPDRCEMCDRCIPREGEPSAAVRAPTIIAAVAPFQPGDRVTHAAWGRGIVEQLGEGRVTVHFADAGYRTLDIAAVLERDLRTAG